MSYLDEYVPICISFEGSVPNLYLDTRSNPTVGVGFLVPTAIAACGFPFYLPGGTTLATAQEITVAWNRVKAMQPGMVASAYAYRGCPTLLQADIDAHLISELTTLDESLQKGITGYANLPDPAKLALIDSAWNLGLNGLLRGYPKMLAAVESGNWQTAAAQCHRNGIPDTRNTWTANQYLSLAA